MVPEPNPAEVEVVQQEKTDRFPCPSCGGNMEFDPSAQALVCPYCRHKVEIEKAHDEIKEYDFNTAEDTASQDWGSERRVIKCESCGAETVLGPNDAAQFCAFCGSSHIVKDERTAGIKPESLVAFKVTKNQALGGFSQWIKKRWFAPNALKTNAQTQRITGVYFPCWTYDTDTYSTYVGEAGEHYWVTETQWVTQNGKRVAVQRQVQKTRWWPTSGVYSQFFDDVLVNASKQVNDGLMSALAPFNLKELTPYESQYLSGFLAERYSVGLKDGWMKAKQVVDDTIHDGCVQQIKRHADEARNVRVRTSYSGIKFKHILLPVWVSAYTYNGKVYQYMVNGQTGEVQGQAPVSAWKVAGLIIGIAAAIAIVYFLSR